MLKNSILMSVSSALMMLLGIINQYFLAKYLTQHAYGEFQLILSWVGLLGIFSLNGFSSVVIKAVSQGYPRFVLKASSLCFIFSILGTIALLILGYYINPEKKELFLLASIFFPFFSGINLFNSYLTGVQAFTKKAAYALLGQLAVNIAQIASVIVFSDVKLVLFLTLFINSVLNFFTTAWLFWHLKEARDKVQEKELIRYGGELSLISIIPVVAARIQYIILESFTNPTTLILYAAAQVFPEKFKELLKNLLVPLSVYLSSITKERNITIIQHSVKLFLLFGFFISLFCALFLPLTIHIIYGDKYNASIPYAIGLLTELIYVPLNFQFSNLMLYHGYKKTYSQIISLQSIGVIVFYFILIPIWGIIGIILAKTLLTLFTLSVQLYWFRKQKGAAIKTVLILSTMEKPVNTSYVILTTTPNIEGISILKVIEADYMFAHQNYPYWIRVVSRLSATKKIE